MKTNLSRRNFVRSGALVAAGFAVPKPALTLAQEKSSTAESPIRLGLAMFRNFGRAQMIDFMKQLQVSALNAKRRPRIISPWTLRRNPPRWPIMPPQM